MFLGWKEMSEQPQRHPVHQSWSNLQHATTGQQHTDMLQTRQQYSILWSFQSQEVGKLNQKKPEKQKNIDIFQWLRLRWFSYSPNVSLLGCVHVETPGQAHSAP